MATTSHLHQSIAGRVSSTDVDKLKNCNHRKTVYRMIAGLSSFGDSFNDDLVSSSTGVVVAGSLWLTPQLSAKPIVTSLHP
jgi:hypothetical protein